MSEYRAIPLCYDCAQGGSVKIATYACVSFSTSDRRWLQRFLCTSHSPAIDATMHPF
jgi:hypothetical protein